MLRETIVGSSRSGRWRNHRKSELIEDALSVNVRELIDTGSALWSGNGTIQVRNHAGRTVGQPSTRLLPLENGTQALAFTVEFDSRPVWQVIPILRPTENRAGGKPCLPVRTSDAAKRAENCICRRVELRSCAGGVTG
jgi:hypothetical protein